MSWNVNRGLEKKLGEHEFCKLLSSYDIVFLSECWVNSESTLDLFHLTQGYASFMYPRTRGKGGGMVILVRDELLAHFSVCKYVGDSMVWVKLSGIYKNDVYICFVYIAHENSVFYNT